MYGTEEPVWCVVANVGEWQVYGEEHELRQGSKHFVAGTKIYVLPGLWGDGAERLNVIGRHRGSAKMVEMVIASKLLTNWRVKQVYHPHLVKRLKHYRWTEEQAKQFCQVFKERQGTGG